MQSVLAGFVLLLYKLLNSLDIFPMPGLKSLPCRVPSYEYTLGPSTNLSRAMRETR